LLMPKLSAGILVYRVKNKNVEVFLCHPGGPFYKNKDNAVGTIPKGEFAEGEDPFGAAKREFKEETGHHAPHGNYYDLGNIEIPGKLIYCWAIESDFNESKIIF